MRQATAERLGTDTWEAITDSPEQANEAIALEEMAIQAAEAAKEAAPE